MDSIQLGNTERLSRVDDFGITYAVSFPAASLGGRLFAIIHGELVEIRRLAGTQVAGLSSAQEGTASKSSAYDALHNSLARLNRTARSMAAEVPGVRDKFRMPHGNSAQALLNAARAFVINATPLEAEFIEYTMPVTFLADLEAEIVDLERAISVKHQDITTHVTATEALDEAFERALNALRRLDGIVRNTFYHDRAILAAWESASHPEHHARKSRVKPPVPPK